MSANLTKYMKLLMSKISHGRLVVFLLPLIVFASSEAPLPEELDPEYLAGIISYAAERGYLSENDVRIDQDSIEILLRREPTSQEIGNTIDVTAVIPAWSLQFKLRKANYTVTDIGPRIVNRNFVIRSVGPLRVEPADDGWHRLQLSVSRIYSAGFSHYRRLLTVETKTLLLKKALNANMLDLSRFRFSPLMSFENRLWIFDSSSNDLYELTSGGDFDDEHHPPVRVRKYSVGNHNFGNAAFQRKNPALDIPIMYGLWACFKN